MYLLNIARYIFSYLIPLIIEKRNGEISQTLEIGMVNGHYTLDTSTVNYSYGGLHTLFLNVFKKFKIREREFHNVLILGFGAGSIVSILKEDYKKKCAITAVEKDKIVIELGKKYFNTDRFKNLNLIHDDAYHYVLECKNKFDLIIIDVFVDNQVPPSIESKLFIENINRILSEKGIVFFNKIVNDTKMMKEAKNYKEKFRETIGNPDVYIFSSNQLKNWVIIYDKIKSLPANS